MKILFIVFNQVGRGTYLRAHELARALTKLGHEMTILASAVQLRAETKIHVQDGLKIIEVSDRINGPTRAGWDLGNLSARIKAIRSLNFDLVHGFESRPTVIYPALTLHKKGVSLFLDWADWFGSKGSIEERPNLMIRALLRPFENYYETHFRKLPLGTSVICRTLAQRAISLGVPENKVCLLPNGFDVENWSPISTEQARLTLGLAQKQFFVGYLGSFFPNDATLVIDTFNRLTASDSQIKFMHIGYSNYRVKPGVNHSAAVIETGPKSFQNMQTYLSACDVLLLPFKNNPANNGRFPLKFSNYLACGRPIIATDVGDIPHYIKKHRCGIVIEDSPEALVQAIHHLKAHPDLGSDCGQSALELSGNPQESWLSRATTLN